MTRILTFLLGFYVATIMKRWWAQITGLPKIADIAMVLNGLVMEGMRCFTLTSVDKVSHFKSLTRLRDFFIKSHEIYETFETLKT